MGAHTVKLPHCEARVCRCASLTVLLQVRLLVYSGIDQLQLSGTPTGSIVHGVVERHKLAVPRGGSLSDVVEVEVLRTCIE
jgi:hypothetical protein